MIFITRKTERYQPYLLAAVIALHENEDMDLLLFYLKGLIIGFLIAAPIGPVALFCIEKTIAEGRYAGFVTGLGSTLADTILSSVALFSIAKLTDMFLGHWWVRAIGALILLFFGIRMFLAKPNMESAQRPPNKELENDFFSAFLMNIVNPVTLLAYITVFFIIGAGIDKIGYVNALPLIGGVVSGSALWWLTLSYLANIFRERVHQKGMKWINMIAGIVIGTMGLVTLYSLVVV